jgi:hypothetical protein
MLKATVRIAVYAQVVFSLRRCVSAVKVRTQGKMSGL